MELKVVEFVGTPAELRNAPTHKRLPLALSTGITSNFTFVPALNWHQRTRVGRTLMDLREC